MAALLPFMQANSSQILRQAATSGESSLNAALHQLSGPQQVERVDGFVPRTGYGSMTPRTPSLRGDLPLHEAVPVLVEMAEMISKDGRLQAELRAWRSGMRPSKGLVTLVVEIAGRGRNPWGESINPTTLSNQNQVPQT